MRSIKFTEDQYESFINGEVVELKDSVGGEIKIFPPCEESEHDWSWHRPEQIDEDTIQIGRRCTKCTVAESTLVDVNEQEFEDLEL